MTTATPSHLSCRSILVAATIACTLLAFALPSAPAQAPAADPAKPITYDAVSIKPNSGGTSIGNQGMIRSMVMMRSLPDGFTASNANVRMLIASAYNVKDDQVSGGPDWLGSKGYDINAKVTGFDSPDTHQLTKEQRAQAMQALLADRFKLACHMETKQANVYELTVAKGGPKLKVSDPSAPPPPPPANLPPGAIIARPPEGAPNRGSGMIRMNGPGNLSADSMTMAQLADNLSRQLHQTVIDKTGLTDHYDFSLNWTPDNMPTLPAGAELPAPDPSGPSIYTALQEQLGLKLNSTKGPVQTLVIDHIEPPTEN